MLGTEEVRVVEHRKEVELGQPAVRTARPEAGEPHAQRSQRGEDVGEHVQGLVRRRPEHHEGEDGGEHAEADESPELGDVQSAPARQHGDQPDHATSSQPHRDGSPDPQIVLVPRLDSPHHRGRLVDGPLHGRIFGRSGRWTDPTRRDWTILAMARRRSPEADRPPQASSRPTVNSATSTPPPALRLGGPRFGPCTRPRELSCPRAWCSTPRSGCSCTPKGKTPLNALYVVAVAC